MDATSSLWPINFDGGGNAMVSPMSMDPQLAQQQGNGVSSSTGINGGGGSIGAFVGASHGGRGSADGGNGNGNGVL